jgi:beta-lactamase regulating signal transducer with metallopeptidase domain
MLAWFAETTVVAMVLAAVAAVAGRVRPIGPTARHVLWLAVLVKLMTPPLVSWPWAVPRPDLGWLMPSCRAEPVCCDSPVDDRAEEQPASPMPAPLPATIEVVIDDPREIPTTDEPAASPNESAKSRVSAAEVERGVIVAWMLVTGLLAAGQAWCILRFRRRLRLAVPAPDDLVAEAHHIAAQFGARAPEILVVPELGTPMLWCLGRPRLLLPAPLVKTLDGDRWRGILAHELAHLRRGDHWVCRLELVAGLLWWWNPLFWLTRARLDAEAELACDAWVIGALPEHRLVYAETLFDIGSALSRAVSPAPALGAAGSGRFLERRLTMILHERVPFRLSPMALLAAALLVLFALPSWSATVVPAGDPTDGPAPATLAPPADPACTSAVVDDDDDDDDDDADDDDDVDDDDDDDDSAVIAKAKKAEAKAKKAKAKAEAKEKARKSRAEGKKGDSDDDSDEKPDPEFEKKMEALGEKIGKEMEAKFGPGSEFEKKMEQFGKEMEEKFGPEFEKKMEALGKEMEAKFGPGSDFEKQMKELGKELGAKLGPGSEFEKQMKDLGQKMKQQAEAGSTKTKTRTGPAAKEKPKAAATKTRRREARIAALEAQIRKLAEELKALEAEGDDEEEDR